MEWNRAIPHHGSSGQEMGAQVQDVHFPRMGLIINPLFHVFNNTICFSVFGLMEWLLVEHVK